MEEATESKTVLLKNKYVTVPVIGTELSGDCPELSRVLEMSNYLATVKGLQELLDNSLLKMMQQFHTEYGRVYLLNETGDRLVLASSQGIVVAGLESMGIEEGFSGKAARSGCFLAQRISDMEDQERAALLASRGLESVVCLPLIAMDNTLGVMNLAASRLIELDLTTIDLMVVLGNLIAVSILNARQAEALEQKARALEAQKEAIRFFAYTASHDLKSPATAINGLARMLLRLGGETMDYKTREVCAQISKAAAVIEELAGELNAYIKAKEATLEPEEVDLAEVLDLVRANVSGELERRGILWRAPERPTLVWADKLALTRALQNLVDNALKYGGKDLSLVEVGHQLSASQHIIHVRDDGVGLDPEQAENLFSLFGRGATSKGTPGTGLGLAIVREIAQRHGGEAWLEGRAGQGCTFCFSLKRKKDA
jgi:signal transduction histidine kinase